MKGDFSRMTFDRKNSYSQVLLQQGRVLLDADFNELAALSADRLRRLARDMFGPHAGPVGPDGKHPGFFADFVKKQVQVGAGRYYVDGLAVNNPAPALYDPIKELGMDNGVNYLLYLDVWERHVTWLDTDGMSEPALDGPDTATRAQVAWRVRAASLKDETDADIKKMDWVDWLNRNLQRWPRPADAADPFTLPQMQAWTDPQASDDDVPCVADPAGGYRGLENQLYRVEIHTGNEGGAQPTFKWSRENGSVVASLLNIEGNDLLVEGIHDTARGFSAGQWVELTSLENEDAGQPGVIVQLVKVDGLRLTFENPASATLPDPHNMHHPLVRRWDQRELRSDKGVFQNGVIQLDETRDHYTLEAGIKIAFLPLKGDQKHTVVYRPGDYWLIPARPSIGSILWPRSQDPNASGRDSFLPQEPAGVEHVYAPLA
ncbi:MAG TPA: DUF6519 domain-containing protein, partial [Anaerolineales bacterium]